MSSHSRFIGLSILPLVSNEGILFLDAILKIYVSVHRLMACCSHCPSCELLHSVDIFTILGCKKLFFISSLMKLVCLPILQ